MQRRIEMRIMMPEAADKVEAAIKQAKRNGVLIEELRTVRVFVTRTARNGDAVNEVEQQLSNAGLRKITTVISRDETYTVAEWIS